MSRTLFTVEPGKLEINGSCIFDAHPDAVFKAYTCSELIPQWWGPAKYQTLVDRLDARPGGQWRFIQRDSAGHEFAFHGVFHSVESPARLVYTFEFECEPGHVILETIEFEDFDGRTRLRDAMVFQSREDRDDMLEAGMVSGALESMERLAGLLVEVC